MPQLIAMVIVVVGAMIYMFQTFGGTGDKIEGIAQKTSIITEIANIKQGLQLAARDRVITKTTTLTDLAKLGYFADQINNEIGDNTGAGNASGQLNTYSAISFGGEASPSMLINLIVNPTKASATDKITKRPGIRVVLLNELADNSTFLESQVAEDLKAVASIDRITKDAKPVELDEDGNVPTANSVTSGDNATDGTFTIYYKDIPATVNQE
ncbi:hypothetical protein [Arcobacter sp. YIC-310]|uniref:hypothetical protein n=1 Tax=Arcobacter sp. YIC-310 TaxID=3376632 RepID=UPI003C1E85FD